MNCHTKNPVKALVKVEEVFITTHRIDLGDILFSLHRLLIYVQNPTEWYITHGKRAKHMEYNISPRAIL